MSSIIQLGELERVSIRSAWPREDVNFTQWLAEPKNIELLSTTLGIDIASAETEKSVGSYRADIFGLTPEDEVVIVENQFGKTDHDHLGKLLTYGADLDAKYVVWIAEQFTEQHQNAIVWLNEQMSSGLSLFAVQLELWRIGDSAPAPRFHVVAEPNDWVRQTRSVAQATRTNAFSEIYTQLWQELLTSLTAKELSYLSPYTNRTGWYAQRFKFPARQTWIAALASCRDHTAFVEIVFQRADSIGPFESLFSQRMEIEDELGASLTWQSPESAQRAKIQLSRPIDITDQTKRPELIDWYRRYLVDFRRVFAERLPEEFAL